MPYIHIMHQSNNKLTVRVYCSCLIVLSCIVNPSVGQCYITPSSQLHYLTIINSYGPSWAFWFIYVLVGESGFPQQCDPCQLKRKRRVSDSTKNVNAGVHLSTYVTCKYTLYCTCVCSFHGCKPRFVYWILSLQDGLAKACSNVLGFEQSPRSPEGSKSTTYSNPAIGCVRNMGAQKSWFAN